MYSEAVIAYLITSGILIAAGYIVYKLMLSKAKMPGFNRGIIMLIYLTAILAPVSFVFADFSTSDTTDLQSLIIDNNIATEVFSDEQVANGIILSENIITNDAPDKNVINSTPIISDAGSNAKPLDINGIIIAIASTGSILVTIWMLMALIRVFYLRRNGQTKSFGKLRIILLENDNTSPFSLINTIYISRNDFNREGLMIIEHEIRHIKERHFIDLAISRLCCIAMWWNPAVWLLNKEMRAIHEFQADSGVLARGHRIADYQMMLVKKAAGKRMQFVTSSLTNSTLKSRFKMMRQPKAGHLPRIKAIAILPVMATIIMIAGRSKAGEALHNLTSENHPNNNYWESNLEHIADNLPPVVLTTSGSASESGYIDQAETRSETSDVSDTTADWNFTEPNAEQKHDATQSDDDIHWAEIISTEVIGNNNTAVYLNHTALARQIETEIQTELQSEMAELKKELDKLSDELPGAQYGLSVHDTDSDNDNRNNRDEYATDASSQNIKGVYANLNTLNGSTNVTVIIDSDRPITTVGSAMVNINGKRYPTKVTNVTPLGQASGQYQTKVNLSTKQLDKFSRQDYASLITNRGTVKVKIKY